VHRSLTEVGGDKCYRLLAELPDAVESLIICTKAEHAPALVLEAKENGIKRLWFQQGADFSEAIVAAEQADINQVNGKCILMYAPPVTGIHAVHRFFVKLFGKL
jgi:predicted CoA-binding protein